MDIILFEIFFSGTQENPTQLNMAQSDQVKLAPFVKGRPLILLLHGYTGHKNFSPNTEIRPGTHRNNNIITQINEHFSNCFACD